MPRRWNSSMARTCTAMDSFAALITRSGSADAQPLRLVEAPSRGQIAVEGIMGGGLVRHRIGTHAPAQQLGEDLGGIAEEADGTGLRLSQASLISAKA